jgi:hypothetical protein
MNPRTLRVCQPVAFVIARSVAPFQDLSIQADEPRIIQFSLCLSF